jgi:hypothetical protein
LALSISSAIHMSHLSSAFRFFSIGPPLASTHIFALPAASASNLPALRMFISATNTLRKSGFSLGSRCFTMPGPDIAGGKLWPTVRLLLGVPSAEIHIGGADAFAVRTVGGRQLCKGMLLGGDGDRDLVCCFDFLVGILGEDEIRDGRSSCQKCS